MTVAELCARMSAAELAEWRAYYRVEPFGESWKQTAYQCAMAGNIAGGKRGGGKFTPDDFLPVKPLIAHRPAQTSDQMLSIFKLLAQRK